MREEKRLKILLVDSDKAVQDDFIAKTNESEDFVLLRCVTGVKEALELIRGVYPDIVITALTLEQGYGATLLREIRNMQGELPVKPYAVALTHNISGATARMLSHYADCSFSKDTIDFGADLVLDYLNMVKEFFQSQGMKKSAASAPLNKEQRLRRHIEQTIINCLNISPNLKGRAYIIEALMIGVNTELEPGQTLQHQKDIYPTLRRRHKTSESNINAAITAAITKAWKATDPDTLGTVYPAYIDPDRGMPTSGEFLKYFVTLLRNDGWAF